MAKSKYITRTRVTVVLLCFIGAASCAYNPVERHLEGAPLHHTDRGFRNLHIEDPNKSFFSFVRMRLFDDVEWADHEKTASLVPFQRLDLARVQRPSADQMQVSWLGHSTFLVQYQGVNVLTDPIFSDRASPLSWSGPARYTPHTVEYEKLPPIDAVIISHNHYDHLDSLAARTLLTISPDTLYLVPLGLRAWFLDMGVKPDNVVELDWWQHAGKGAEARGLRVQAMPSQHWSARGLWDRRETLWASWRIEIGDRSLWFAGDTGYNPVGFKEIGDRAGPVDLALIPIGAYDPRFFMKTYHVDPDEAVMIHQDVRARRSIGMHWGTYPLTAEEPMDPPTRLAAARERAGLRERDFQVLALGETIRLVR